MDALDVYRGKNEIMHDCIAFFFIFTERISKYRNESYSFTVEKEAHILQ